MFPIDYYRRKKKMKIYALKWNNEYIDFSNSEFKLKSSYQFEREDIKNELKIITGTFVEDTQIRTDM